MTENVQKIDLSGCDLWLGFLAMCLLIGFMWACKPAKEVANTASVKKSEKPQVKSETPLIQKTVKPQVKSEPPSVENVVFEPEQMENGSVPTDMKIMMTKEVNAVNVDGQAATGAGKNWSIKLENLKLEKKILYPVATGAKRTVSGAELMGLNIGWINKDGTVRNRLITVHVMGKKDGTFDGPRLVRISLISL